MRILMHGFYEHFGNHKPVSGEPFINCYNDNFVSKDVVEPNSIALLIEPRSIDERGYCWIECHPEQYKYVFTHDSRLLKMLPNAKPILYGGVWGWSNEPKTKLCSMISSDKTMCELHIERLKLARKLKDKIDVFGTFDGGSRVNTFDSHSAYKYAVVIENYIDEIWFTEKICNCFANRVIPVYLGAEKIGSFFDTGGILRAPNFEQFERLVMNLISDPDRANRVYESSLPAIEENYKRVEKYRNFETWFFNEYDELLEGLK